MYSFENVTILWGGRPITGMPEDGEVSAERNEDQVMPKTGIQGETAYAKNPNRSGVVTFTLMQTSASLSMLRTDAAAGQERAIMIRDASDTSRVLLQCDNCVITKVPKLVRGKEIGNADINIYVPVLDIQEG